MSEQFAGRGRPARRVVFYGQSFLNVPAPPNLAAVTLTGTGIMASTLAVDGSGWADLAASGKRDVLVTMVGVGTDRNDVVLLGGQGDIVAGTAGADTYGLAVDVAAACRAANPDVRVWACTIPPAAATILVPSMETQRLAYNEALLEDPNDAFDGVADIGALDELQDPFDTDWFSDGTHWTAAGQALGAALVRALLL